MNDFPPHGGGRGGGLSVTNQEVSHKSEEFKFSACPVIKSCVGNLLHSGNLPSSKSSLNFIETSQVERRSFELCKKFLCRCNNGHINVPFFFLFKYLDIKDKKTLKKYLSLDVYCKGVCQQFQLNLIKLKQ